VKRELQIKEDVTPQREATMKALLEDFKPYSRLKAYDVYRR
jgi:Fe2+ or Zn2+ uptake regulation protein